MQEKLQDVFNILHDGVVVSWSGDKSQLDLKIECQYLAERILPSYDHFHLQLIQIERLILEPWMNGDLIAQEYFLSLQDIFTAPLEVKSSEIKGELVVVYCSQSNPVYDYCGGNLYIKCADVKLFDHVGEEMTIDELKVLSSQYWEDFGKH
jgi:hypothetical protein